jgi:hypothetical protein
MKEQRQNLEIMRFSLNQRQYPPSDHRNVWGLKLLNGANFCDVYVDWTASELVAGIR